MNTTLVKKFLFFFSFCQESTAERQEKRFFILVYIPQSEIRNPNIRIIFYQIYTFLFLICDISVIIIDDLDKDLYISQFNFILDIIKISDLYLINVKKSTGEMLNEEDSSNDKEEEELRKQIIDNIAQKAKENIKKNYKIIEINE